VGVSNDARIMKNDLLFYSILIVSSFILIESLSRLIYATSYNKYLSINNLVLSIILFLITVGIMINNEIIAQNYVNNEDYLINKLH